MPIKIICPWQMTNDPRILYFLKRQTFMLINYLVNLLYLYVSSVLEVIISNFSVLKVESMVFEITVPVWHVGQICSVKRISHKGIPLLSVNQKQESWTDFYIEQSVIIQGNSR
jgi:hypothetical protein